MKKSKIAKLALMGASITALAATLTTSTYAWYVSNRQADVTGGYGATGSAGSDGSIQVSWNTETKKFSKSISFTDSGATHNAATAELQPVHYDSDGFYSVGVNTSTHKTIQGSAAQAKDVLTFTVVLKSNQTATQKTLVTPSIKIKNFGAGTVASGTAAVPTAQQVLVGNYKLATSYDSTASYFTRTGAGTEQSPYAYSAASVANAEAFAAGTYYVAVQNGLPGKELNDTFVVDALKAMYVQQSVTGGAITYVAADDTNVKVSSFPDTEPTGANAHTYYKAVTGNEVDWGNAPASATGLGTFYIQGTAEVVVTYNIFLEGGDVDCFNSCVGQNFSFDLTFQGGEPETISQP